MPKKAIPHLSQDCTEVHLLSVSDIANDYLKCSERHVRRLADTGRMPAPVRLGNLLRWRCSDIESWIENRCPDVGEESRGDEQ